MKAIVCPAHGGPHLLRIEEMPTPLPKSGEVLIQTKAIGVNYVDTMRCSGKHPSAPKPPFVPGIELAGTVVEIGPDVNDFKPGDEVMSRCISHGAYAEMVCAEERFTITRPDGVTAESAAAIYVTGQTAFHALVTIGNASANDGVLITAAAGGVGSIAVQMAKALGCTTIAASGSRAKCERTVQLGANYVVDYSQANWADEAMQHTNGDGADLILESVGGKIAQDCMKCWADQGRMIVFGRASGKPVMVSGDDLLFGHRQVAGMAVGRIIEDKGILRRSMTQIMDWVKKGKVHPLIGERLPLAEAGKAHQMIAGRKTMGKILLIP